MFDMPFILQSPLAMLGLLTLLIPLGIHLLSKARPQVVAFAHIAFIKVSTYPVLRQLRLTQLMLLGIRMLMLLIATLILTQLYWQNTNQQVNSHILLTEDWLNHTDDHEKQTLIDQAGGSNLMLLGTNNRSINVKELTQWSVNHQPAPALNIWSKVASYTAQQSADALITVYTTNRLKQFVGSKISLHKQVEWHIKMIPAAHVTQLHSANIKVIYDNASESLLGYLRAAFEVINTHENLSLDVDYISTEISIKNSGHLLNYDKTINLSEQGFTQLHSPFDVQWQHTHINQADLSNIQQADFVFTLTRLLYSSQSQVWWLENTRLSRAQITQGSLFIDSDIKDPIYENSPNKKRLNSTTQSTSLHIWLVMILVVVFMLERVLSEWPNHKLKPRLGE